jgi:hypothetical protein
MPESFVEASRVAVTEASTAATLASAPLDAASVGAIGAPLLQWTASNAAREIKQARRMEADAQLGTFAIIGGSMPGMS